MCLGFDLPIVCHAEKGGYFLRLLLLARDGVIIFECRGLDLCPVKDPLGGFHVVNDANAW